MKTTVSLLICILSFSRASADVLFGDTEFNDSDWEIVVLTHAAGGTLSSQHQGSGGSPDAYRYVTNKVNGSAPGTRSDVLGFHRRIGAIYQPAIHGAIHRIDYSESAILFSGPGGDGQATGPALRQDGKVYVSFLVTGQASSWHTIQATGLVATNFLLAAPNVNPLDAYDYTQHPDFSESGPAIEFGFFRNNGAPTNSLGYSTSGGVDNWSLTVKSCPRLSVVLAGSDVILRWPSVATNVALEATETLPSTLWSTVTNTPARLGDDYAVTSATTGRMRFFRLKCE